MEGSPPPERKAPAPPKDVLFQSFRIRKTVLLDPQDSDTKKLLQVLYDGPLCDRFREFLEGALCTENLFFWHQVESFNKAKNDTATRATLQDIYSIYFDDESLYQVNLPYEVVQRVREKIAGGWDKVQVDIFHEAQSSIFALMKSDLLPKFLRSKIYLDYLEKQKQVSRVASMIIEEDVSWTSLAKRLKDEETGIPLGERKWMFKMYSNCFSGREAVKWIIENTQVTNRKDAVSLGQMLLERGVIAHVQNKTVFLDSFTFFYRFKEEYEAVKSVAEIVKEMPKTLDAERGMAVHCLLEFYLHSPEYLIGIINTLENSGQAILEEFSYAISSMLESHVDTSVSLGVLYFLLEEEFKQCEHQQDVLPSNSIARKVLDSYIRKSSVGCVKEVLVETLNPIVFHRELCIELNTSSQSDIDIFLSIAQQVFEVIFNVNVTAAMPRSVKEPLGYVIELSRKYSPKKTNYLVGSFLLRMFTPALFAPEEYGLIPLPTLKLEAQKNLGMISNMLEWLLHGGLAKTEWLPLKNFISLKNLKKMNEVLSELSNPKQKSGRLITIGTIRRTYKGKAFLNAIDPKGEQGVVRSFLYDLISPIRSKIMTALLVSNKKMEIDGLSKETLKVTLNTTYCNLLGSLPVKTPSKVTIHYSLLDPDSRAVVHFCLVNSIDFEPVEVDMLSPQKSGKVPLLKDDDLVLTEGTAILRYLASKYYISINWYPTEPTMIAQLESYLEWHAANLKGPINTLFTREVCSKLLPSASTHPIFQESVSTRISEEKLYEMVKLGLSTLNVILSTKMFITGPDISVADLITFQSLEQRKLLRENLWGNGYSFIARWIVNIKTKLTFLPEVQFKLKSFCEFVSIFLNTQKEMEGQMYKQNIYFSLSKEEVYKILSPANVGEEVNDSRGTRRSLFLMENKRVVQTFQQSRSAETYQVLDFDLRSSEIEKTEVVFRAFNVPSGKDKNSFVEIWNSKWRDMGGKVTMNLDPIYLYIPMRPQATFKSILDESARRHTIKGKSSKDGKINNKNIKLESVVQDTKIVQQWRNSFWPEDHFSIVTYNLESFDVGTRVTLLNERVPLERSHDAEDLWEKVFKKMGGVSVTDLRMAVSLEVLPRDLFEMLLDTNLLDQYCYKYKKGYLMEKPGYWSNIEARYYVMTEDSLKSYRSLEHYEIDPGRPIFSFPLISCIAERAPSINHEFGFTVDCTVSKPGKKKVKHKKLVLFAKNELNLMVWMLALTGGRDACLQRDPAKYLSALTLSNQRGEQYSIYSTIEGENIELKQFSAIVRTFQLMNHWVLNHNSKVFIHIEKSATGCQAVVSQYNIPLQSAQRVVEIWNELFWYRLQGTVKHTIGILPNPPHNLG